MIELIKTIDTQILLWINGANTPMLDFLMYALTGRFIWIPCYVLLLYAVWAKFGAKRALQFLLLVGMVIFFADQFCGSVLRYWVARPRPTNPVNPISDMIHIVYGKRSGSYGFPSCHAANMMGLAVATGLMFKSRAVWIFMLSWAVLVSYTRVYMGVHYPTDILCGWIIGGAIAWVVFTFWRNAHEWYRLKCHNHVYASPMSREWSWK